MSTERRPGAVRSESARLAILSAAAHQFAERGYDHLTIEGIAAEAGVGKQTIYRWWSSKSALIAECLVEGMLIPVPMSPPRTGDLRADLEAWVGSILEFIPGNESLLRSLVVAAAEDADVAQRLNERLGVLPLDGEDDGEFPVEVVEALVGVIVIRSLRRGEFDEGLARRLVELVLPRES
jgi:AcrR family transcriptional regulator